MKLLFRMVITILMLQMGVHGSVISSSDNLQEIKLGNGMTLWLKPTKFETDEVLVRVSSLGGYGAMPSEYWNSAQISASLAWESGLGNMSIDQLSAFLYKNGIEFDPRITPFSRVIDGECQGDSIDAFFRCVNFLFTEQKFTPEGWELALSSTEATLKKAVRDEDQVFESSYLLFNTNHLPVLKRLTLSDLSNVSYAKAKEVFQHCFSDPSAFVCVVVGSFEPAKVTQSANKFLGSIPAKKTLTDFAKPLEAPFPAGISENSITLPKQNSSQTRLTFPLKTKIYEDELHQIAFICQVIEARLKRVITEMMSLSYGVDVSFEFPLFPFLSNPWISIRYRCDEQLRNVLKRLILRELSIMQSKGVSEAEIANVKKLETGNQEFMLRDNFYWVSMLSNVYLWGWNPHKIVYTQEEMQNLSPEVVHQILRSAISLTNYSVFFSVP